jgi:hypothetical protein
VERFVTVRRLTETEGLGLAEVRRAVLSRGENEALREQIERLAEAEEAAAGAMEALLLRMAALERRVGALEAGPPKKRRWLLREP